MGIYQLYRRSRWLRIGLAVVVLLVVFTRRGCYGEQEEAPPQTETVAE